MILMFDLDDTLYNEKDYVDSGILAVAKYGEDRFGWNVSDSFDYMQTVLNQFGRGKIFDLWLTSHGRFSRSLVIECVKTYRHHTPSLKLASDVKEILAQLSSRYSLYLITDGHKIVQKKKVEALEISSFFKKILITHRYGTRHAKPSTYCFGIIKNKENCSWQDMLYVGDNPNKDFVNLKPLGVKTVRILNGAYKDQCFEKKLDGDYKINHLSELPKLINILEKK